MVAVISIIAVESIASILIVDRSFVRRSWSVAVVGLTWVILGVIWSLAIFAVAGHPGSSVHWGCTSASAAAVVEASRGKLVDEEE